MPSLRAILAITPVALTISARAVELRGPLNCSTSQAAIVAASSGDTILVADGTYSGPGNRNISFHGTRLVVRSENGPANCTIDCADESGSFRAFMIDFGE